jgi:hypothetical protein
MDNGHFYKPTGEPAHEGGLLAARKNGYYPSVTTISKILNKEGINQYRVNQIIDAATKLKKKRYEKDADYIQRLVSHATEDQDRALELGNIFHSSFQTYFETGDFPLHRVPKEQRTSALDALELIQEHNIRGRSEISFANHDLGIGGQIDLAGSWAHDQPIILDFKTQNAKKQLKNGKPQFTAYPEWAMQLAAYRYAASKMANMPEWVNAQCVSFIISTNPENQGAKIKVWDEVHARHINLTRAFHQFTLMTQLYYTMNNLIAPANKSGTNIHNSQLQMAS